MNPIFALDASGKTASVCVLNNGRVLFQETLTAGFTHSETLLPLAQKAMQATGLTPKTIGLFAVTNGPGSFTGLRIALALIKGLALPSNTPVAAVSTLHAMALASGLEGTVVSALDARRGDVYWAAFACEKSCTRLTPDAATPVQEIAQHLTFSHGSYFFVGDGAHLCYTIYNYSTVHPAFSAPNPLPIAQGAAFAALQLANAGKVISAQNLCPNYLRLSQAERERAQRLAGPQT